MVGVVEVGGGGQLPRLGSRCVTTPVKRSNCVLIVPVPNSSSGTQAIVALAAAAARHYVTYTHARTHARTHAPTHTHTHTHRKNFRLWLII